MTPKNPPLTKFAAVCIACRTKREVEAPVTFTAVDFMATCAGRCRLKRFNKITQDIEYYGYLETTHRRLDIIPATDKV